MNILPKKRWHVRTKENIARVRRDEAEAAEKEKQENLRIEQADREARLNKLKLQSKKKLSESGFSKKDIGELREPAQTHVNLFTDLDHAVKTSNKEHDKEIKEKSEEYEKKIGYLTYLGQDTNEALKKKNWYEVLPESSRYSSARSSDIKDTYDKLVLKDKDGKIRKKELNEKDGEVSWKEKQRFDPLYAFKKYCKSSKDIQHKLNNEAKKEDYTNIMTDSEKNKRKKHNKKEDKLEKLRKLREARLNRERQEQQRTNLFLASRYNTILVGNNNNEEMNDKAPKIKPKYNSQFNPELARQNYR